MNIKEFLNKFRRKSKKIINTITNKPNNLECPDCNGDKWFEGPSGGMCVNISCVGCGSRFNDMGPFGLQRLDSVDTTIKRDSKIEELLK